MSAAARQLVRNPFIGLPSIAPTQTVVNFFGHARCSAQMVTATSRANPQLRGCSAYLDPNTSGGRSAIERRTSLVPCVNGLHKVVA